MCSSDLRRGDNFIPLTDVEGAQRQVESISAGITGDARLYSCVVRELSLEVAYSSTTNVLSRSQNLQDSRIRCCLDWLVLAGEIDGGNFVHALSLKNLYLIRANFNLFVMN